MRSDVDYVLVLDVPHVVADTRGAQESEKCLLMVQDSHTPPGYAKLQAVDCGTALCVKPYYLPPYHDSHHGVFFGDKEGRAVLNLLPWVDRYFVGFERHGPARTLLLEVCPERDYVPALRCQKWPDCAEEWLSRKRRHNWPDPVLLNKCRSSGCFFVQVGHPNSDEKDLQWRISFSLQERCLVTHFNSTQLKCFILLKLIKKGIIRPLVKEEAITSYHCKTCMLYMIENTPAGFWRADNLLTCLCSCLKLILSWSETGVCPNYFIPAENIFDGRLNAQLRVRLCHVLQMILSSDFKFLLQLRSDNLGTRLQNLIATPRMNIGLMPRNSPEVVLKIQMARAPLQIAKAIITSKGRHLSSNTLSLLKQELLEIESITEHTQEETQRVISLLLPYIDLSLMSELIVSAKRSEKSAAVIFGALMSDKWREISAQSDSFSAKLKQANYLYILGHRHISLDILTSLNDKIHQNIIPLCCCYKRYFHMMKLQIISDSISPSYSAAELQKHHVIPCVEFLPEEKDLTPTALCYEMKRQCSASAGDDRQYGRYDMEVSAVIDGKILLYFLMYLNHRALGMEAHIRADIEYLHRIIGRDPRLSHEAADLNILGWICKDMGRVDKAMECFNHSLAIMPQTNAAIMHVKDIETVLFHMLRSVSH